MGRMERRIVLPEGPVLKRALGTLMIVCAILIPLWALAETTSIGDSRDVKGLLDVSRVKVEGRKRLPRWTFVTFKPWSRERIYDRGFATVFIDTFGDFRSDYYALVRATATRIEATLFRDRKNKRDYEMGPLKTFKPGGRKVTVRVPLRKLKIPDSALSYSWFAETLMTGEQCPRVCIDRVPDDGSVEMILVETPDPTPTVTPTPTPTVTPTPSPTVTPTPSTTPSS
jgi:hypothetical protein